MNVTRDSFPTISGSEHTSSSSTRDALPECAVPGSLRNVNTSNEFKATDKNAHLKACGAEIWKDIQSGKAVNDPARLLRFTVLSFADIKNHSFVYWFGFPALVPQQPTQVLKRETLSALFPTDVLRRQFRAGLTLLRLDAAAEASSASSTSAGSSCPPFFLAVKPTLPPPPQQQQQQQQETPLRVLPLSAYESLSSCEQKRCVVCMVDPCGLESVPGWPLRNLLALVAARGWGASGDGTGSGGGLTAETEGGGGGGGTGDASAATTTTLTVLCYRGTLRRLDLST